MEFIHAREWLNSNQYVRVMCDTQCNVLLMDDANFAAYKQGDSHRYYGGFFEKFPAELVPPHAGYWNVTLDLAGGSATIRYTINVFTAPTA